MPDNTIDWGQGSVNNDIAWGAGAATNSVGWGEVHEDSYGHDETNLVGATPEALAYQTRVEDDGGTFEGLVCLSLAIVDLKDVDVDMLEEAEAFQTRVSADSGTNEGLFCLRKNLIELNNISIN